MYSEASLLFPYFQSCSQETQQFGEMWAVGDANAVGKLVQTSTISEYNLGGEGDLFKAPEPITTIIEEPILDLDLATISIISGGEDGICSQAVKLTDILTMQTGPLLDDVFYECNDLLEKPVMHESSPEIPDVKVPVKMTGEGLASDHGSDGTIQKSTSAGCLTSTGKNSGLLTKSNFLNFQSLNIDTSGMRRAFSEGDMQTLISMGTVVVQSPRLLPVGCYTREEREERLLRYRKKKNRRNFGRKIKYACRKALADSQPRVRGRFARIEETAISPAKDEANPETKKISMSSK